MITGVLFCLGTSTRDDKHALKIGWLLTCGPSAIDKYKRTMGVFPRLSRFSGPGELGASVAAAGTLVLVGIPTWNRQSCQLHVKEIKPARSKALVAVDKGSFPARSGSALCSATQTPPSSRFQGVQRKEVQMNTKFHKHHVKRKLSFVVTVFPTAQKCPPCTCVSAVRQWK